jgi:hypothetical protein
MNAGASGPLNLYRLDSIHCDLNQIEATASKMYETHRTLLASADFSRRLITVALSTQSEISTGKSAILGRTTPDLAADP